MDWAAAVPDSFTFSIKASQRITHHARLKDTEELMSYLLRVCTALGDKRGPTLFQLPPNMKLDLAAPRRIPAAHPEALEGGDRVPPCHLVHRGRLRPPAPARRGARHRRERGRRGVVVPTAPYGYLRLHKPAYDARRARHLGRHDQGPALGRGVDLLQARQRHRRPRARRRIRRALRLTAMPSVRTPLPLTRRCSPTWRAAPSMTPTAATTRAPTSRSTWTGTSALPQQAAELADPATTTLILEDDDGNAIGYTLLGVDPVAECVTGTGAAADQALLRRPGVEGDRAWHSSSWPRRCRGAPAREGNHLAARVVPELPGARLLSESAASCRWESRPTSSATPWSRTSRWRGLPHRNLGLCPHRRSPHLGGEHLHVHACFPAAISPLRNHRAPALHGVGLSEPDVADSVTCRSVTRLPCTSVITRRTGRASGFPAVPLVGGDTNSMLAGVPGCRVHRRRERRQRARAHDHLLPPRLGAEGPAERGHAHRVGDPDAVSQRPGEHRCGDTAPPARHCPHRRALPPMIGFRSASPAMPLCALPSPPSSIAGAPATAVAITGATGTLAPVTHPHPRPLHARAPRQQPRRVRLTHRVGARLAPW